MGAPAVASHPDGWVVAWAEGEHLRVRGMDRLGQARWEHLVEDPVTGMVEAATWSGGTFVVWPSGGELHAARLDREGHLQRLSPLATNASAPCTGASSDPSAASFAWREGDTLRVARLSSELRIVELDHGVDGACFVSPTPGATRVLYRAGAHHVAAGLDGWRRERPVRLALRAPLGFVRTADEHVVLEAGDGARDLVLRRFDPTGAPLDSRDVADTWSGGRVSLSPGSAREVLVSFGALSYDYVYAWSLAVSLRRERRRLVNAGPECPGYFDPTPASAVRDGRSLMVSRGAHGLAIDLSDWASP
ncbi:MAG: hypothetical protein R3B82_24175 [Sandaracinaceae bacterium]